MDERAEHGLRQIGEKLDLREPVRNLSMAQKQIVAIARALALEAKVIFMDEPTTALTKSEIDALFRIIHGLREKGVATVFVSHKLDEVFRESDNITVLRDGKKVGDFTSDSLDEERLAYHMTGREILYTQFRYSGDTSETQPVLRVRGLTREPHYRNLDLDIYPGEIVGLTGPLGAGRTEFALSLFGLNKPDSGTIEIGGKPRKIAKPDDAIDAGVALVPEDRHVQGLFQSKEVRENLIAAILSAVTRRGFVDEDKVSELSERWFKELRVKASSSRVAAATLSGGNQQRVVIGKWLATEPRLLILDGPTVGIDVASKSAIHEMVHELAQQGMAIMIISDEIPEVYKNSNRVVVMRDGEFVYRAATTEVDQDTFRSVVEQGVSV
jgi:simple sugar transport system ATP-binding protein